MSAPTRRELNEAARDMCLLVTRPPPPIDVLAEMTTKDVTEIENWAALMHLDASDNDVPVPERPAALTAWQRSVSAPTEHSLDCPGCGDKVFTRSEPLWYTDEEEHCPGCGSRVMVALDEDDADPDLLTARVYVYEHGGEVVARLRAEVDLQRVQLKSNAAQYSAEVERLTAALADSEHMKVQHAEVRRLDVLLGVEMAVRVKAEADRDELNEVVDDADARLCESADEIARLRERVRAAESPARAKAIIAAWGAAGDQMWANKPADTPEAICLDGVDLASIHGTHTATPMTGPEFTPDGLKRLRAGVRRARGETPGGEQP